MWRRVALTGALAVLALLLGLRARNRGPWQLAQYRATQDLAAGKLLIAKPNLGDPNFAESVVLLIQFDEDKGTLGLIINRRTKVPLSRVFPRVKGAAEDPVYAGGPVETSTAQVVFRSRDKHDNAIRVVGGVWASGNKDVIEKWVGTGTQPEKFRVYAGYGGWSPGQLEHEIELGGWSVLRATPDIVFDADPDSLWQRLQHTTETRIASLSIPPPLVSRPPR